MVAAMGETLRLSPRTEFPTYRRLRLPKGDWCSEIVRYADFVQMHACCQYCLTRAQPTILDVGAYHGEYAVILGKIAQNEGGKLIAIEPNPTSFAILRRNIALNGLEQTVALEQVAVTEQRCALRLRLYGSQSTVATPGSLSCADVAGEPLVDIIGRHQISAVDLMIIDVEGAELLVLRSFPWDTVPVGRIFCEMHPYNWASFEYGGADFEQFLHERRLKCLDMYLMEHRSFPGRRYLGPCLLSPYD